MLSSDWQYPPLKQKLRKGLHNRLRYIIFRLFRPSGGMADAGDLKSHHTPFSLIKNHTEAVKNAVLGWATLAEIGGLWSPNGVQTFQVLNYYGEKPNDKEKNQQKEC